MRSSDCRARCATRATPRARRRPSRRRSLEAARCELLVGQRLLEHDRAAGVAALENAAGEFDELGVTHLATRARELAGSDGAER